MTKIRYWIGVVSEDHVRIGEKNGFAQLCHGKAYPLKRMKAGDWLVYYSPKTSYKNGLPLQSFTAIGKVKSGEVYLYEMNPNFIPNRIDVEFKECQSASYLEIKPLLNFARMTPNVGLLFRRGHFEIEREDFLIIAKAMGVKLHEMGFQI
jgi:hypothetical protein